MSRRIDRYRMTDGKTALAAAYFNAIWQDIDLRIDTVEQIRVSWEEAVSRVSNLGLARINEVLAPAIRSVDTQVQRAEGMLDELDQESETALAALEKWKTDRLEELNAWRAMLDGALPGINERFDGLLPLAGGKLQGPLTLAADPITPLGAATKAYADSVNLPPGSIIYVAGAAVPSGYLKANGAAVSRTAYPSLLAAIGLRYGVGDGSSTFHLPDLRGYFLRGWDDGRGIDTGRLLGSTQADANLAHTHTGTANTAGEHTHSGSFISGWYNIVTGSSPHWGNNTQPVFGSVSPAGSHTHTLAISTDGGSEARPKNMALMACIKF